MENRAGKISVKQIIWYTIIFSIVGLIIETVFCYITTGVIESRKGLIWGPFCPVYGVGATILIVLLDKYKDKGIQLFLIGCVFGNLIEYGLSYLLEAMYGTRFWDYAYLDWDLNGRICLKYSIFWGILSVGLIKYAKQWVDKLINKIPNNKILHRTIITFIAIDCIATIWAVNTYQNRVVDSYYEVYVENDNRSKIQKYIEDNIFSNEIMQKTFPNLRYIDENGKEYYLRDMIKKD